MAMVVIRVRNEKVEQLSQALDIRVALLTFIPRIMLWYKSFTQKF